MPSGESDGHTWPHAIVFDLDGTIADTAADIQRALNDALVADGLAPIGLADVKTMIGAGPVALVRRALRRLGAGAEDGAVRRLTEGFQDQYDRRGNSSSRLFPDVRPCLDSLRDLGIRMGICSNKPEASCLLLLRDLGALHYFEVVHGFGSGLPPKPDPQPLLRTIERLGATQDQALYVGDSETDVATARAAGIPVALVGHGYSVTPVEELGGDWLLPTLADLPGLCQRRQKG